MLVDLRHKLAQQSNTLTNLFNRLGYNITSEEEFNEVLDRSFNEDQQKRVGTSQEVTSKIRNIIQPYNPVSHKHTTCCLCQEDISKEGRMVVNCPKCEQVFCAESDEQCGGFFKHTNVDDRCPCCREKLSDWFNA